MGGGDRTALRAGFRGGAGGHTRRGAALILPGIRDRRLPRSCGQGQAGETGAETKTPASLRGRRFVRRDILSNLHQFNSVNLAIIPGGILPPRVVSFRAAPGRCCG